MALTKDGTQKRWHSQKMVLTKDGRNERRNASEYLSNSVTWCMKDSAYSFGLIEDKINYEHNTGY
jgi:ribosomal protein L35AE/L33A